MNDAAEEDPWDALPLRESTTPNGVTTYLPVRVQTRASRERIEGVRDGALRVAVTAPPVDGEANESVVSVIAKALGLPRSAVEISQGARGRSKIIAVAGLTAFEVRARLRG